MKKQVIIFLAMLSSNGGMCSDSLFDPVFAKALANFFKQEKAENVEDMSSDLTAYSEFLKNNNVACSRYKENTESDNYDWFFNLKEGEAASEEMEGDFDKYLCQESTKGVILSSFSPLQKIVEKRGYIRDPIAENALVTESFTENSVHVFRPPKKDYFKRALKEITHKTAFSNIKNIDFIYLINLDKRPEKWDYCLSQLTPYGVHPHRFSAIYGWGLSPQIVNDIIFQFTPGMKGGRWISYFPFTSQTLAPEYDFLTEKCYGKSCVFNWMSPGAIGCALSHLSILQDAYDSGYETIWIMEDDILVQKDPHLLTDLIEKLDQLVGKNGWDILYTDTDEDKEGNGDRIKSDLTHIWRPDVDSLTLESLPKREILSDDFVKIHSRSRAHSLIVRRSGMKKILDHLKTHRIFIPYDDELALIPDIKLFNLRYNCVAVLQESSISDTEKNVFIEPLAWPKCKQEILAVSSKMIGWHSPSVIAEKMMDFICEKRPKICVEIGAFGGLTSYRIAKTLEFLNQGIVHSIDAWDNKFAEEGLKDGKAIQIWESIDMGNIYKEFQNLMVTKQLEKYCHPIRQDSRKAAALFEDESIDFLYIDGNTSTTGSFEDVFLYFPKVKEGGFIWISGARLPTKHQAVDFLMKHCTWLKEESPMENIDSVFQKKSTKKL